MSLYFAFICGIIRVWLSQAGEAKACGAGNAGAAPFFGDSTRGGGAMMASAAWCAFLRRDACVGATGVRARRLFLVCRVLVASLGGGSANRSFCQKCGSLRLR